MSIDIQFGGLQIVSMSDIVKDANEVPDLPNVGYLDHCMVRINSTTIILTGGSAKPSVNDESLPIRQYVRQYINVIANDTMAIFRHFSSMKRSNLSNGPMDLL